MSYWRACERIVFGSILVLSCAATSRGQEQQPVEKAQLQAPTSHAVASSRTIPVSPPSADTWQFRSLSYLWFPGMSGTVGARGYDTSASVSPSDILKNLNIGIMGSFEPSYNRWAFPFDYVWAKLQDKKALVNFPGYSAKATVKEGFLTPKVNYLLVDSKMLKINATAGIRFWHLGQSLQLTPPTTPSVSIGTSQNWVDALGGANIVVPLSTRIAAIMLGDAGGGGANVDYQVAGFVNYQIKPKWGIGVGYRYVDVNYRNNKQFVFDTHQSGIALTLLYKYGNQPPIH